MNIFDDMEKSIRDFESLLGVGVTIIDDNGVLHSENGLPLFSRHRQSHRKNDICDAGFDERCVAHCRHAMNAKGEKLGRFFFSECWKGVIEIVVPLMVGETHLGSFFIGSWRAGETNLAKKLETLPSEARKAYIGLPEFDPDKAKRIADVATLFTRGMLSSLNAVKPLERRPNSQRARISRFIHETAAKKAKLADLAAELSLSPSRASHLVKELFGKSLTELIVEERIRRAKTLLLSTDDTAAEIAANTGFTDERHFNKLFKKHAGEPPGRFRDKAKTQTL